MSDDEDQIDEDPIDDESVVDDQIDDEPVVEDQIDDEIDDEPFVDEPEENAEEAEELSEVSLEDLGAAYARAAAEHDPEAFAPTAEEAESGEEDPEDDSDPDLVSEEDSEEDDLVTPEAIIEAALFIGHPKNEAFTEQRLASLMRDVSPEDVVEHIDQLNRSYREEEQALRIVKDEIGYRMTIAPEVEQIRRSFLGKVREARLSQMAIEVLALVAYQPGITAQKVQDQRGRESGPLLNQLVRRQLLRMDRLRPEDGGRPVPHYYTTERFLVLFGLESIDDLPQVEEGLRQL